MTTASAEERAIKSVVYIVTAGVFLSDHGDYVIAFVFEDGSRPGSAPAEASFDVTIARN